jgi:hypothetical protein
MTRACPVTNTRALGLQLRREVAVVADLVYSSEHRCVEHPVGDGVLVELPHGREQMVDPPGAAHTALSGAGALDRCRLQHHHEQPERSRPGEEVPPAPLTPRQVAGEVAGIRACRTLSSISAETEVTQVGVSQFDRTEVVVDDRPIREGVGQRDPQRPHEFPRRRSQLPTWRTIPRGCNRVCERLF